MYVQVFREPAMVAGEIRIVSDSKTCYAEQEDVYTLSVSIDTLRQAIKGEIANLVAIYAHRVYKQKEAKENKIMFRKIKGEA